MNGGQIYYAVVEERGFLKLAGVIRHPLSQRLSQAARRVLTNSGIRGIIVDLQEAQFIDSTCLGLLARVATRCLEQSLGRPIVVSTQKDVTRQLETMGLDQIFVLVKDPASPGAALYADAAELADLVPRPDPKMILDAHRALCELNLNNQHLFQSVIEILDSEAPSDDLTDRAGARPW